MDFIKTLYFELLLKRKKRGITLEVYKRFLKMRYKMNIDTESLKTRIYDQDTSNN
jgi:hypothetical protein